MSKEDDLINQYGTNAIHGPSSMVSIQTFREVLDSGYCPTGPWRTDLLESVRLIKKAPACPIHARHGLRLCNACRKTVLCMKCDTIECQCQFILGDI